MPVTFEVSGLGGKQQYALDIKTTVKEERVDLEKCNFSWPLSVLGHKDGQCLEPPSNRYPEKHGVSR